MLDDADQRELAQRMRPIFEDKDLEIVFVGSTAIVGMDLFPRTSKDTDALGAPNLTVKNAREILEEIADEEGLVVQEKGWGTIAVANLDEDGDPTWEVDLLVPERGPIPKDAARRIHEFAEETDIGPTAIPEHILATKAIAYGDCRRDREQEKALQYENDLLQLDKELGDDIDWDEVDALLSTFPTTRARDAAEKLHEIFGIDLGSSDGPDRSIA